MGNFSAISLREQVAFEEMIMTMKGKFKHVQWWSTIQPISTKLSHKKGHDVRFTICTRPSRLVGFFMVLVHWNNSPQGDMSLHSDALYCMNPTQKAFVLSSLCCVLNGETINTNCIVFGLTRPELEPTIYRTRVEHANDYATNAVKTRITIDFNSY